MPTITAPDYTKSIPGPLVFLAGPVQGAEDWQKKAIEMLDIHKNVYIASPRGNYSNKPFDYDTQVDWETFHLNHAAYTGAILFWLAKEKEHICDRAYAQTTRYELGEWITKSKYNPELKIVMGIEPGFSGERYIKSRIRQNCPNRRVHSNLEDTCREVRFILNF